MLFKNITEFTAYLPVSVNFEFSRLSPYIKSAERKWIKDILGTTEYEAFEADYSGHSNTADMAGKYQNLLPYCQDALAFMAFEAYLPVGNVNITDSGIHIKTTDKEKAAFSWQVEDLRESIQSEGYSRIQTLLQFLWDNADVYTDWYASTARSKYLSLFIAEAETFSEYADIQNSAATYWTLRPYIRTVQAGTIQSLLEKWETGKYAEILSALQSLTTLSGNNATLYDLIKPALANLAISMAIRTGGISINSMGIIVRSSESGDARQKKTPIDHSLRAQLIREYETIGQTFLQKASEKVDLLLGVEDDDDDTTADYNDSDRGTYGFL